MRAVDQLQTNFQDNGVEVVLRSIPYHVTSSLPDNIAGICVYQENGRPVGIAINRRVLNDWMIESATHYGFLYKALLHEIGHCFFGRDHDDGHLEISLDLFTENSMDLSVMISGGLARTPKVLWPYYVKEIAGLDRINTQDDLMRFLRDSHVLD